MKTEMCIHCDGTATVTRRNYPCVDMGVPVELQNIEVIDCLECGSIDPIIPNMDGLMAAMSLAIVCSPRKLMGEEVRFLRKYVGKSAVEFSRFMHVDPTHLSKIENGRIEIGAGLDKLVRLLVVTMSDDLKSGIEELLALIPNIEDNCIEAQHSLQLDPQTGSCHYAYA